MSTIKIGLARIAASASLALLLGTQASGARADAVTDWNTAVAPIIDEARMATPPAVRVMALVQTASYVAVNAITGRYPQERDPAVRAAPGASIDAAVAAAHRATLGALLPAQRSGIDSTYQAALAKIADGPAKDAGIAVGEAAAAAVMAARSDEAIARADAYRPHTSAGVYVPTVQPAVPQWPQRRTWVLASPSQFRPAPPPALSSEAWARAYNEVKTRGVRNGKARSADEAEAAAFWEYSRPAIYHGVVRSVAAMPGREATQNARLFAVIAQAMDDALVAVFDAKYHYHFWRPLTAIRNGDQDGNEATERDESWAPMIDTPMHPEYPSAHSTLAEAVVAVLRAELGRTPLPQLSTSSPTAKGAVRRWTRFEDFVREIGQARIDEGVHYRFSIEAGNALGRQVGQLAVDRYYKAGAMAMR